MFCFKCNQRPISPQAYAEAMRLNIRPRCALCLAEMFRTEQDARAVALALIVEQTAAAVERGLAAVERRTWPVIEPQPAISFELV